MPDNNAAPSATELKTSGLRVQLPRLKVLEVFQRSLQRHLTAEDVYRLLLESGSDVGLATVYRLQRGGQGHLEVLAPLYECPLKCAVLRHPAPPTL